MRVAILETGRPPGGLAARFGDYPGMLAELLGPGFATTRHDAAAGALPAPDAHPAYLITGSPAGVYDPLPWNAPLEDFLRAASEGGARLVGICFGHQIMAEAFGGRVEKSDKGWGVGLQTYEIVGDAPWLGGETEVAVPVSHQDQVVVPPPAARIVAANAFTTYGVLAYEDRPAVSMQFHPEFSPAYARALIEARRAALPDPDAAIASLDARNDRARVAAWIRRFLTAGAP